MMDANANWVLLAVLFVVAAGFFAVVTFARTAFERYVARSVALPCPETGTAFEGVVEKDLVKETERVVRCARLDDPSNVTCHQRCLRDLE